MSPPAGFGQAHVLATKYLTNGNGPVAYLDETYHLDFDDRERFYVMAAVVVEHANRDLLRQDVDALVPDGYWHTTNELRTLEGREQAKTLLKTLQLSPETCVVVNKVVVSDKDLDGSIARRVVLGHLLAAIHSAQAGTHAAVNLAVLEEQREARANNWDRTIKSDLVRAGHLAPSMELVAVSPGSEHLLWLPDLACSAYRQQTVHANAELLEEIKDLTHVIVLP